VARQILNKLIFEFGLSPTQPIKSDSMAKCIMIKKIKKIYIIYFFDARYIILLLKFTKCMYQFFFTKCSKCHIYRNIFKINLKK
jgi:hypothetical protein